MKKNCSNKSCGQTNPQPTENFLINNVLSCCGTCNFIRQDLLTVEEMEVAMKAVLNFRACKKESA